MAGTRAENRQRWQAVRDADFSPVTVTWLGSVAASLLLADDTPNDNARRGALPAALGLSGHYRGPKGPTASGPFLVAALSRARARSLWESVALQALDRETLRWVANVAGDVLAADDEPNRNTRRARLAEAVGLVGHYVAEVEALREVVRDADHTGAMAELRTGRPAQRGERAHQRRERVYAIVRGADRESPEAIDARIKRALKDGGK